MLVVLHDGTQRKVRWVLVTTDSVIGIDSPILRARVALARKDVLDMQRRSLSALEPMHITLRDASLRLLHDVQVTQDSVIGMEGGTKETRVAISRTDVRTLQRLTTAWGRTLLLVGGIAYALATIFNASFESWHPLGTP
ncbi:MAG: hypothetical protein ABIW79_11360 [Gemmatimonas sp.]